MAPSKAAGEAPPDYNALARERERLAQIVAAPNEKETAVQQLAHIEQQLAARREDDGVAAASARRVGIRRAVGSLMNEYGEDRQKVRNLLAATAAAFEALNARARQIQTLHKEDAALCDRFALEAVHLPMPPEPETEINTQLPQLWVRRPVVPGLEPDEHRLRERRSYIEAEGTEGYRIIVAAGLKSWPALTPEQQAVVAERVQDKLDEAKASAQFAREAAHIVPEFRLREAVATAKTAKRAERLASSPLMEE